MSLAGMGIKFVSKDEIEAQRQAAEAVRAARDKSAEEARRAEGARRKQKVATGEATWVAPALERRLQHKEKKEKKERKREKHKHKHKGERSANQREDGQEDSDSDSTGDEMPAASSPAIRAGGSVPLDRDAAGLGFMMKASARPAGAVSARAGAGACPVEDQAAAADSSAAKARLDRELNPYAAAGKDSSEWTRSGVACFSHASHGGAAAAHATPPVRAAGTDGGASWKQKQLLRAVEHARESGEALQAVCLARFGTLDSLSEMERISQRLDCGNGDGGGKGGGKGSGNPRAHLQAIAARQRAYRKQEEQEGAAADDAPSGMLRPSICGSLSWGGRGRGAAGSDEVGGRGEGGHAGRREDTPQRNTFRNDGKFLTDFLEGKEGGDVSSGAEGAGAAAMRRGGCVAAAEAAASHRAADQGEAKRKASVAAEEAERAAARAEQRRAFLYGYRGEGGSRASSGTDGQGGAETSPGQLAPPRHAQGEAGDKAARALPTQDARDRGVSVHPLDARSVGEDRPVGVGACEWARQELPRQTPGCASESVTGVGHRATAADPASDGETSGPGHGTGAAAPSTAAIAAATPGAVALDANQLMARALRAKMGGNLAEFQRLQALAAAAPTPALPPPAPPPQPGGASGGDASGGGRGGSIELLVPDSAVGLLIGKGGITISAMAAESGARIRLLNDPDPETGQRVVLLRGGPAEVDKAQLLLEAKLNESAEREAQRGGSQAARREAKRARGRRDDRPATTVQMVPEFDAATGQLKIVERRVEVEAPEAARLSQDPQDASTKRPKMVQRYDHETGERARFFRDDDGKSSLSALVAEAKRGAGKSMDAHYADNVARMGRKFKGPATAEDEYEHDDGVEMHDSRLSRKSDAQRLKSEASSAAAADRRTSSLEDLSRRRFNERKHLVVALGEHVYLRLEERSPIGMGHCVIEPMEHVASHVDALDEVAVEARNFQKCLVRMFEARGAQPVFFEQHLGGGAAGGVPSRHTMAIECVPLPLRDAAAAPGYFKQAILASDEEWAQHKKIYETGGCVRGTVPPGFAYFDVSFGLASGYAHVIEDQAGWDADFGRHTLEGLLEMDEAGIPLRRRAKLPFEEMQRRVVDFGKAFAPFDWTQQL